MNVMASYFCELYKGTPAELALEPYIAALGLPYRLQFPLFLYQANGLKFFPDVLWPTIGFILEIDDDSHMEKAEEDAKRTALLGTLGYRVVRCTNEEALHSPEIVVLRLAMARATLGDRNVGLPPCKQKKRTPRRKPAHPRKGKGVKLWNSHSLSWLLSSSP